MDTDPIDDLTYAIEWYRELVPPADAARGPFTPKRREIETTLDQVRTALALRTLSPDLEWF